MTDPASPDPNAPFAPDAIDALLADQRPLPPIERWSPEQRMDSRMRILRDGSWTHEGTPIVRIELVRLFAGILCRDGAQYWLVTPTERQRVDVDDAPFIGVAMLRTGEGRRQRIAFTTNVGRHVLVDDSHPLRAENTDSEPNPMVVMDRGLHMRLSRSVFYGLVELAMQPSQASDAAPDGVIGVWSSGSWFPLGSTT